MQKEVVNIFIWHDKRVVTFISSFKNIEDNIKESIAKTTTKPEMIRDYDKNMGGVDKFDMMLKAYYPERKNVRWTNKFSIYCLHMIVHNANALYTKFYDGRDKVSYTVQFRLSLSEALCGVTINNDEANLTQSRIDETLISLQEEQENLNWHLPEYIE